MAIAPAVRQTDAQRRAVLLDQLRQQAETARNAAEVANAWARGNVPQSRLAEAPRNALLACVAGLASCAAALSALVQLGDIQPPAAQPAPAGKRKRRTGTPNKPSAPAVAHPS